MDRSLFLRGGGGGGGGGGSYQQNTTTKKKKKNLIPLCWNQTKKVTPLPRDI